MKLRFVAVLTTMLIAVVACYGTYQCGDETVVPENLDLNYIQADPFYESNLQIFSYLTIPCDGKLVKWMLVPQTRYVNGLYLAVFRKRATGLIFDIVGWTHMRNLTWPSEAAGSWVFYPLTHPISVRKDDLLGFYYDKLNIRRGSLTICTEIALPSLTLSLDYTPISFSLPLNASQVSNGVIDASRATQSLKLAAMGAVLQSTAGPPPTTRRTTTTQAIADYYYDEYQYTTTTPLPRKVTMNTKNTACALGQTVVSQTNRLSFPNERHNYQNRLHIIRINPIPCDGKITEWYFMPQSSQVVGLHLAVFREIHPLVYVIVGSTYIESKRFSSRDSWVSHRASRAIPVKTGDAIGFYYDNWTLHGLNLTIPTVIVDITIEEVRPSYLLPLTAREITNNGQLSAASTNQVFLAAAFGAIVEPMIPAPKTVAADGK